jgi:hypothetical protein
MSEDCKRERQTRVGRNGEALLPFIERGREEEGSLASSKRLSIALLLLHVMERRNEGRKKR